MKLKNIKFRNTDHGSSPFEGIILTSSKGKKQGRTIDLEDALLYENIDGIILEGDWEGRLLDLVGVLEKVQEHKLGFLLKTSLSFDEFKLRLGIASFEKVNNMKMPRKDISENDLPMLTFIGAVLMDFYLNHTEYYVETQEKEGVKVNVIGLPSEEDEE